MKWFACRGKKKKKPKQLQIVYNIHIAYFELACMKSEKYLA